MTYVYRGYRCPQKCFSKTLKHQLLRNASRHSLSSLHPNSLVSVVTHHGDCSLLTAVSGGYFSSLGLLDLSAAFDIGDCLFLSETLPSLCSWDTRCPIPLPSLPTTFPLSTPLAISYRQLPGLCPGALPALPAPSEVNPPSLVRKCLTYQLSMHVSKSHTSNSHLLSPVFCLILPLGF